MKQLLFTIAAVVLVGCGESQQSTPTEEAKPVDPVAEAPQPEPPTTKAPDISIWDATYQGNIEAVKQHLAAGTDVNAKNRDGVTPLHLAALEGHKEIAELLIAADADVNAKDNRGGTPLHFAASQGWKESAELLITAGAEVNAKDKRGRTPLGIAIARKHPETADLLRKRGGKTGEELKAEGK